MINWFRNWWCWQFHGIDSVVDTQNNFIVVCECGRTKSMMENK